jgi:suppressor of ftsI/bilirubin oxidase
MTNYDNQRRQFLQYSTLGILATALPGFVLAKDSQISSKPSIAFKPDVEVEFISQVAEIPIMSGANTSVFKYYGKLLKGPETTLKFIPGYLGPILNLIQGQKVRIWFYNQLPEPSIIHWHGMHVPQKMDGHPMYAINHGEKYVYEFEVKNPAGTNWYHSHTHEMTATQVYSGLAGLITVTDEQEQRLDLPSGEFDIPIIIQDHRFTIGNQLQYIHRMRERMMGFLGDTILVNGKANSFIPVKTRAYRLRVLNASNSRIYKLGWEDGTPLTVIGTDGGLLEKPEAYPYIMLAPAERVELWVDFNGRELGSDLELRSLEYHSAMPHMHGGGRGMGHGMGMMMDKLPQGEAFPILKFHIAKKVNDSPTLPNTLIKMRSLTEQDASNPANPLSIAISMQHMSPQLNGKSFDMYDTTSTEKIPVNTIQKIRISNGIDLIGGGMRHSRGGMGMMMSMAHPIHLHGQQFKILSRTLKMEDTIDSYATVKDGFITSGWKDTVLVMPGEEIEILKPFENYTGLFLYHCHNLEHEDMGMMRNFYVG